MSGFRDSLSRRQVLQLGGGLGLGAIAGCLGDVPLAEAGVATKANWLYDPGTIRDRDHYWFSFVDAGRFVQNEDLFDNDVYDTIESIEDEYSVLDLHIEDIDTVLRFDRNSVLAGDFSTEDLIGELEDHQFDEKDEHGGYRIYLSESGDRGIGVRSGSIVNGIASANDDGAEVVEAIVDTRNGEEDRYIDEEEDFAALTDVLSSGAVQYGQTYDERDTSDLENGRFDHAVAKGYSVGIDGETTHLEAVIVFDHADDIDTDDVEEWVDNNDSGGDLFDDVEEIGIDTSGRSVVVSGRIDTDSITSYWI